MQRSAQISYKLHHLIRWRVEVVIDRLGVGQLVPQSFPQHGGGVLGPGEPQTVMKEIVSWVSLRLRQGEAEW